MEVNYFDLITLLRRMYVLKVNNYLMYLSTDPKLGKRQIAIATFQLEILLIESSISRGKAEKVICKWTSACNRADRGWAGVLVVDRAISLAGSGKSF